MTEPKHIPLPKRWSDSAVERLVHWLQTPDEALIEFDDDPTEEEYKAPPLPTDAELAAEYDRTRGYDRPIEERRAEVYEAMKDAPVVRWTVGQKTPPEFVECDGKCITAAEVGVPEAGGMYAVDPECTLHSVLPRALEQRAANDDD